VGWYLGACVVNLGLAHLTANCPAGTNKLRDFNTKLLRFNILTWVFPVPQPVALLASQPQTPIPIEYPQMNIDQGTTLTYDA
jgi:hypothetical protein